MDLRLADPPRAGCPSARLEAAADPCSDPGRVVRACHYLWQWNEEGGGYGGGLSAGGSLGRSPDFMGRAVTGKSRSLRWGFRLVCGGGFQQDPAAQPWGR